MMTPRPTRRAIVAGLAALPLASSLPLVPATAAARRPLLIRGARHVVTMAGPVVPGADVLVVGDRIRAIGPGLLAPGAEVIDASGCVVMPGFVDTHWHMWNTAARGLATSARGGFVPTMAAFAPHFAPEDNAVGVRLALAEAVDGGITTVHDWAHNIRTPAHAEAELAALVASGVRGRFAYGYPNDLTRDRPMDLAHLATIARRPPSGLVSLGICARGPDRSVPAVWQAEWDTAHRLGLPISTHIASDAKAAALRGIDQLAARDGLRPTVQLVHLTGASDADLATVARAGSPVSISPWTEMEVGYGLTPVARMRAAGLRMGLSVDTMTLAGRADMFGVMRVTGDLAAGAARMQGVVADATVLSWATLGGAEGLGLADRVGSLEPGKRADLIAIRADALHTAPAAEPTALVTHAASPADVDLVLIDGVVHKRGGRLTRVDVAALRAEATASIARIRRVAGV